MQKLISNIQRELDQIANNGVNTGNLDMLFKLVDIQKDLYEIKDHEDKSYSNGQYGRYYDEREYGYDRDYGRRDAYMGRERYRGEGRLSDHIERIKDGADRYGDGKERFHRGDSEQRMQDGLEGLMYGVCMLVESAMDAAETPQEKEIIRKHVQKIKSI